MPHDLMQSAILLRVLSADRCVGRNDHIIICDPEGGAVPILTMVSFTFEESGDKVAVDHFSNVLLVGLALLTRRFLSAIHS